ncbi:MAG: NAD(P)(+) transhydrogenase (Re/Si-specific) subunit alpha [Rickettsiales bacterium]|nr:NAD(P)(+) transhydrogenase (Re/Si-specific) subunit alpha [Rickettsiales bacterium]
MQISILKEIQLNENRVALSPDMVKKWVGQGVEIFVEKSAGLKSGFSDESYKSVGAHICQSAKEAYNKADIVLKVQKPTSDEIDLIPEKVTIIANFNHDFDDKYIAQLTTKALNVFALERVPRITRAQTMDILSSQSNLAGYRAVIVGVQAMSRVLPMMMTAAGTVMPAKVLVIGAGVAGLQAIATAKRLGAVVSAFDVRPVAKEQVESLGAKFIEVDESESAETAGGYAKEMSDEYKAKQAALLKEALKKSNLVITTALIPGRPAPKIITKDMVDEMPLQSVIIDMAAEKGGNCELTKSDSTVVHKGVKILGPTNLASELSDNASLLFAKNISSFLELMVSQEEGSVKFNPNKDDEIIKATCFMRDGKLQTLKESPK